MNVDISCFLAPFKCYVLSGKSDYTATAERRTKANYQQHLVYSQEESKSICTIYVHMYGIVTSF